MYVRPQSKYRENPQIKPQSVLQWNVSRGDRSPGQSFPALRLPIKLSTHAQMNTQHAYQLRAEEKENPRYSTAVRTHKCVVMFMGFKKPVAFPDKPCQAYVWCSFQASVCVTPLSLSHHLASVFKGFVCPMLSPCWVGVCKDRCQNVGTIAGKVWKAYLASFCMINSLFLCFPSAANKSHMEFDND